MEPFSPSSLLNALASSSNTSSSSASSSKKSKDGKTNDRTLRFSPSIAVVGQTTSATPPTSPITSTSTIPASSSSSRSPPRPQLNIANADPKRTVSSSSSSISTSTTPTPSTRASSAPNSGLTSPTGSSSNLNQQTTTRITHQPVTSMSQSCSSVPLVGGVSRSQFSIVASSSPPDPSLRELIEDSHYRSQLEKFLHKAGVSKFLEFWLEVERFKARATISARSIQDDGLRSRVEKIFFTYLEEHGDKHVDLIDAQTLQRIRTGMVRDTLDCAMFDEAQSIVGDHLTNNYLPQYFKSKAYSRLKDKKSRQKVTVHVNPLHRIYRSKSVGGTSTVAKAPSPIPTAPSTAEVAPRFSLPLYAEAPQCSLDVGRLLMAINAISKAGGNFQCTDGFTEGTSHVDSSIGIAVALWEDGGVHNIEVLQAALIYGSLDLSAQGLAGIEEEFGSCVSEILAQLILDETLSREERMIARLRLPAPPSVQAKLILLADRLYRLRQVLAAPPSIPLWKVQGVDRTLEALQGYFCWSCNLVRRLQGTNSGLENSLSDVFGSELVYLGRNHPVIPDDDTEVQESFVQKYFVFLRSLHIRLSMLLSARTP